MKGRACPICGTKFHACASCGLDHEWEYEFCSKKCWNQSSKYSEDRERFLEFIALLTPISIAMLPGFVHIVTNDDYYQEFKKWLGSEDAELGVAIHDVFYGY